MSLLARIVADPAGAGGVPELMIMIARSGLNSRTIKPR
jgi:hypothetical protein